MNNQFVKRSGMLLALLLGLTWPTFAQFRVIGYLPTWQGEVADIQLTKLTNVNYAFLIPNSNGTLQGIDNPGKMASLVAAAHAVGVKVQISVGGGGGGDGFHGIVASAANRQTFVNNMVNYCNANHLDGVDIDWEYPNDGAEAENFVTMMQLLYSAMHAQGKLCSIAVIGDFGEMFHNGLFPVVDYVGVMAYDDNNFQHSTYDLAVRCMNYWLGRGVPKAKCVLGVPFYAQPNSVPYKTLLSQGADPFADVFNGEGYNGITTMKKKTTLAMNVGSGIMMWELSNDVKTQFSLVTAIDQVVKGGTTPPPPTQAPVGKKIQLKGFNGSYVGVSGANNTLFCTDPIAGAADSFTVVDAGNGLIELRHNGLFVTSNNGNADSSMTCNRAGAQAWEQFSWVVNADGTISLQGSNGSYVSSENGTRAMNCNRPTAQGWEDFTVAIINDSTTIPPSSTIPIGKTIWFQGNNGQYVSSKNGVGPMFCNAAAVAGWNQFLIGDAGNGKVTLSNLGKFVTSNNGDSAMTCNRPVADEWETFTWIGNADGTISLEGSNGRYVTSNNGDSAMTCRRTTIQGWEEFHFGIVGGTASADIQPATAAANKFTDVTATTGLYPNPIKGGQTLTVSLKQFDPNAPVFVTIVDLAGKTVAAPAVKSPGNVFTIATSGLGKGIYLVKIFNGKNSTTQKVIIQ